MTGYRYPQTPLAWEEAVVQAGRLLAPAWPQEPSAGASTALGAVALTVYALAHARGVRPSEVSADTVLDAMDEVDVEHEPSGLKTLLVNELPAAGHTGDNDPLQRLRLSLIRRESFATTVDVPIDLTGGLTRCPSGLAGAAPWIRQALQQPHGSRG
ncbi:hypothetical protein C3486_02090 [Streptomyces sp. Ru73]|nr:hypothetical protein C3486_02090 [Streptomyces sp. Ru73]